MTSPLLEVRNLAKRFGSRQGREPAPWVIRDLSFSVTDGEFLTIIGPSGSGKSTLLNMIAQIDVATGGEILFGGDAVVINDPKSLKPGLDRRIGYVTQDDNLLPWRTTIDNVLFPLEVQGTLDEKSRAHAEALIKAVGLSGYEKYYPHELSGGMRKRTSLIRTLVYDPPVILMDEPFAAVDAQTRIQLQEDLLRLWEMGRKTIIFVTHDIAEAIALGDRTLVLTKQPTRIKSEHTIPFKRPRNVKDIFGPSVTSLQIAGDAIGRQQQTLAAGSRIWLRARSENGGVRGLLKVGFGARGARIDGDADYKGKGDGKFIASPNIIATAPDESRRSPRDLLG